MIWRDWDKGLAVTTIILAVFLAVALVAGFLLWKNWQGQQAEEQVKKAQEQMKKIQEQAQAAAGMNLTQLAQGGFSSIQGTWKTSDGGTIVISGDQVTDSAGKTILQPDASLAAADCGPAVISEPKLENSSFVGASLGDGHNCQIGIIFAAHGIPVDTSQPGSPAGAGKDVSDTTRDRLAMMANGWNAIFAAPEAKSIIYYRVRQHEDSLS